MAKSIPGGGSLNVPQGFELAHDNGRLELRASDHAPRTKPVFVDFAAQSLRSRARQGRKLLLARAVGLKKDIAHVLDATAGFGGDAFVLALLGCRVTAVERSPVMAALLEDGLRRARVSSDTRIVEAASRVTLVCADARDAMRDVSGAARPDVVYLDPMYPERKKSALGSGVMRTLQAIAGDDADAPDVFAAALQCAKYRVVVKRPKLAPSITDLPPDVDFKGSSTRFDAYLVGKPFGGKV